MYCKKCKINYPKDKKYCNQCGEKLTDDLEAYAEAFSGGDRFAFESIYKNTQGWVRARVCQRFRGGEVEDCMQEIYVRLFEKISLYDSQKGLFRPWFNRLLENVMNDYYDKLQRKQGLDQSLEEKEENDAENFVLVDDALTPEMAMDQKESSRLIQEILRSMSEEQRICIMLYYGNGMKQREIAERLGIPEGTVKTRLMHGKKAVKEGVLNLEKNHKTKLYGMSPVLFFLWVLHGQNTQAAWTGIQEKTALMKYVVNGSKATGGAVNAAPDGSGAAKVSGSVKAGAAKATGAVAGKTMVVKVIAAVVTAAVIGGGGYMYHEIKNGTLPTGNEEQASSSQKEPGTIKEYLEEQGYTYVGDDEKTSQFSTKENGYYEMNPVEAPKEGYFSVVEQDFDDDGEPEYLVLSMKHQGDSNCAVMEMIEYHDKKWEKADSLTISNDNWKKCNAQDYEDEKRVEQNDNKNFRLDVKHMMDFFCKVNDGNMLIFMEDYTFLPYGFRNEVRDYELLGTWALQGYAYKEGKFSDEGGVSFPALSGGAMARLYNESDEARSHFWENNKEELSVLENWKLPVTTIMSHPMVEEDASLIKLGSIRNMCDEDCFKQAENWLSTDTSRDLQAFHYYYENQTRFEETAVEADDKSEALTKLMEETIDYDYLEDALTILEMDYQDSIDMTGSSNPGYENSIPLENFLHHAAVYRMLHDHSGKEVDRPKQIIGADQLISKDEENSIYYYKSTAFDKFLELTNLMQEKNYVLQLFEDSPTFPYTGEQFAGEAHGFGGASVWTEKIYNKEIDVEQNCVKIEYSYYYEELGNVKVDENREALIVPADNSLGYCIKSIQPADADSKTAELEHLNEIIDYAYLKNALAYIPEYSDVNDLDDHQLEVLMREAFFYRVENEIGENWDEDKKHRGQVISKDQVISLTSGESVMDFKTGHLRLKKTALDHLFQLMGNTQDPTSIPCEPVFDRYEYENDQFVYAYKNSTSGLPEETLTITNLFLDEGAQCITISYTYSGYEEEFSAKAKIKASSNELGYCIQENLKE